VRRNAEWLAALMDGMGMRTELVSNSGGPHPVVLGEWLGAGAGQPTLTIYGHYDVQPPDPLEAWISPPFQPTVRDGVVFARGAADSKGQHLPWLQAARQALAAGGPPVNLRFLIEGEEESGGHSLGVLLHERAAELRTDYVVIADAVFSPNGLPTLVTALRGLLYAQVDAHGPAVDLHSGLFGGVAPNPFHTLVHLLASMKDPEGRITIPGFYAGVEAPSAEELASWARLGDSDAAVMRVMGAPLEGDPGQPPLHRRWALPSLDIHGMPGGFTGEGSKTVIPAHAAAKFSFRLVPGQHPDAVEELLRAHVAAHTTPGVRLEVKTLGRAVPVRLGTDHPGVAAMREAFREGFGAEPVLAREGFTIPVTMDFVEALGAHMLVTGFVPWDAAPHSPNEHLPLDHYHRGIATAAAFMRNLGVR
jgi:acetylornithine deacetylase/succinyl-diaminopimelate desuccinylase-like protein